MADPVHTRAIAIVGMAGRFPGARNLDEFWRTVRDGVENLETLSDADLDATGVDPALRRHPNYVRKATVLEGADELDAAFFSLSPREAEIIDPQHRVFLECAWEALEHAGHAGAAAGQSVGVFAGTGMNSYLITQLLPNPAFVASAGAYQLMLGNDKDFLATRVAYKLDLRGPSVSIQTACSTSLVAVTMACRALQRGECDMALAGGVSIYFPQRRGYVFEEGMIFSPDGHCRPFDAEARGTRSGAGAGVVVLKRLDQALADRDRIHAVIRGAAINNDGAGKAGYTAPSVDGQVEAIALAHALAGVDARSIGYIETHGTGTPLGDPIEVAALTQVFRASTDDVGFCRLGSLKANVGHLDAAAGVASLIKAVLVLENRELPPLVNFRAPNPQLALETSPFFASAEAAPWPANGSPRRAGVSSFGIGGTNAHVVLEEAPAPDAAPRDRAAHLIVLSARTATALDRATGDLAAHLGAHPDLPLADAEWTLQVGRQAFAHRRAVVVRDGAQAVELLGQGRRPAAQVLSGVVDGGARPVAFLFSGQGSQHAAMGSELYRVERVYREAIDACADILRPHLGVDIREVEGAAVDETWLTQPLLFATEYALAKQWMHWGVEPAAMLGHSIGEYVAAHLAGVLSLEDVLAVIAARGRLMQAQAPGSMVAVPLAAREVERWLGDGVEIAAVNAPELCTLSGPGEAVAALTTRLAANGVQARPLHTSHAFHSAMMEPAIAPFTAALERVALQRPRRRYLSNLTGSWITPEEATSPAYYAAHLRRAVRFEAGVRALAADPAMLLLEVGPGTALTSLARLTIGKDGPKRAVASLAHPRERRPEPEAILEAVGRLWCAGVAIDWKAMHADEAPRRAPLPTYPFERRRYWVDALPAPRADGAPRVGASVADWGYVPTWSRDDSTAAGGIDGTWLILAEPGPLADAVAKRAPGSVAVSPGDRFEKLGPGRFRVRVGSADDFAEVVKQTGRIAGAIHLLGLGAASVPSCYDSLVALVAGLESSLATGPARVVAVTAGAESVLDEPVVQHRAALVVGPVLALPTEVPGLSMRAVDVLPTGDVDARAAEIVDEAARADRERIAARRAGRRWVRRLERIALPPPAPEALPLKQKGTYLITGGLGGIGRTLARWLATQVSARLVLTGRTARADADEIRAIEAAGGEVLAVAADVTDEASMRRAVEAARARFGALDGVIHAAGVAGAGLAFRKSPEEVRAVLAPKTDGLDVLVRVLGDTPLDLVVLIGSVASLVPGPGLSDYAGANAVVDAFVDAATRPAAWRKVMAVDFGPWRDVGMLTRMAQARGGEAAAARPSIAPADGADAFGRALASGRRRVVIDPIDLVQLLDQTHQQETRPAAPAASSSSADARPQPDAGDEHLAPATDTERRLAGIWAELLGLERIGRDDDFFHLGGHSLLATRVLSRIVDTFGARLLLRDVFDAPTLQRLSERVDAVRAAAAGPGEDREEIEF